MGHLPSFAERDVVTDDLLCGVGRLVCAWGLFEQRLEAKIAQLREAAGDVRTIGARTKPTMAKLMGELRAMLSMRDRRNAAILTEIAGIERDIQRIDRFRGLVVSGFYGTDANGFTCRDGKNVIQAISFAQLAGEIAQLERIGDRLSAL